MPVQRAGRTALRWASMPGGFVTDLSLSAPPPFGPSSQFGEGALTKHKPYCRWLLQLGFGFGDSARPALITLLFFLTFRTSAGCGSLLGGQRSSSLIPHVKFLITKRLIVKKGKLGSSEIV